MLAWSGNLPTCRCKSNTGLEKKGSIVPTSAGRSLARSLQLWLTSFSRTITERRSQEKENFAWLIVVESCIASWKPTNVRGLFVKNPSMMEPRAQKSEQPVIVACCEPEHTHFQLDICEVCTLFESYHHYLWAKHLPLLLSRMTAELVTRANTEVKCAFLLILFLDGSTGHISWWEGGKDTLGAERTIQGSRRMAFEAIQIKVWDQEKDLFHYELWHTPVNGLYLKIEQHM